jgi:hypothetical protein
MQQVAIRAEVHDMVCARLGLGVRDRDGQAPLVADRRPSGLGIKDNARGRPGKWRSLGLEERAVPVGGIWRPMGARP